MKKVLFPLFFLFVLNLVLAAQATPPEERLQAYEQHLAMQGDSLFNSLQWREIGPYFCGGRIVDIEGYIDRPHTFLVATASGGLWKTVNNATTWTPLFDNESSITIGDIAVSQSDPGLIWVGTGENNSSRSSYAGTGVFKSTDGGSSWINMGLFDSHHIGRILIDPQNDDVVYVAVIGRLYTENEERGVFKTEDGGLTWEKILYISPRTGVIDLVMHPENNQVLYAAAWERDRKAWHFTAGGPQSAIYKTVDGGRNWNILEGGFPRNEHVGRIGLAISPLHPETIYAFLDNQEPRPSEIKEKVAASGITLDQLSAMSAEDFLKQPKTKITAFLRENNVPERYSADMIVEMVRSGQVNPAMIAGMIRGANQQLFETNIKGGEIYRSDDGGLNWRKTHEGYLDGLVYTYGYYFGEIRVSPDDRETIYVLGVPLLKSADGGRTFKDISTQGGIYGVNGVHADMQALWIDPRNADRLLLGNDGGMNISYDRGDTWQKINNMPLAQSYTVHFDFAEPYNVYTGLQDNGVNVGSSTFVYNDLENPWRMILGGDGAFIAPHPTKAGLVYAAFQFGSIYRLNLNSGEQKSIQPRSPNPLDPYRFNWLTPFMLSHHNPGIIYLGANKMLMSYNSGDQWLEISPDLTERRNTNGNVPFATITALDESPLNPEVLYAGTDDGKVWVTRNRGAKWEQINQGLPAKWVTRVVASKYRPGRVYLTMTGYREDDFSLYAYVSEDFGANWKSLQANLPREAVNVIREDSDKEDILYLGTDLGIYISLDRGNSWYSLKNNLPTNAVYDLRVHPREKELIIGTHGRGVFILPLNKIQQLDPAKLAAELFMFAPGAVTLSRSRWQPQAPAGIDFYSSKPAQVEVSILDGTGRLFHKWQVQAERGINQVSWDLSDGRGRKAEPGDYHIRLKSGKTQEKAVLTVK